MQIFKDIHRETVTWTVNKDGELILSTIRRFEEKEENYKEVIIKEERLKYNADLLINNSGDIKTECYSIGMKFGLLYFVNLENTEYVKISPNELKSKDDGLLDLELLSYESFPVYLDLRLVHETMRGKIYNCKRLYVKHNGKRESFYIELTEIPYIITSENMDVYIRPIVIDDFLYELYDRDGKTLILPKNKIQRGR